MKLWFTGLAILFSSFVSAQESGLWEKAFARPHGAIMVDEITYEPEKFLLHNKGQEVKIAGKFLKPNLSSDGDKTFADIVWGGRYTGVTCVSSDKAEMSKVVDLVAGEEVLATGTVSHMHQRWLYLDNCTIEDGVTLFHSRDPKFILGTWCGVYEGKTFRKINFTRSSYGQYRQTLYDIDSSGNWQAWSSGTKASRVKRTTTSTIETAFIGAKYDHSRDRYTILSHNKMSKTGGFYFYRCR